MKKNTSRKDKKVLNINNEFTSQNFIHTKKLKVNKDIKLDSGAMWSEEDMEFLQEYDFNLTKLIEYFPANKLYLHPIKLSKWK